jgi:hypothetical protein
MVRTQYVARLDRRQAGPLRQRTLFHAKTDSENALLEQLAGTGVRLFRGVGRHGTDPLAERQVGVAR